MQTDIESNDEGKVENCKTSQLGRGSTDFRQTKNVRLDYLQIDHETLRPTVFVKCAAAPDVYVRT